MKTIISALSTSLVYDVTVNVHNVHRSL